MKPMKRVGSVLLGGSNSGGVSGDTGGSLIAAILNAAALNDSDIALSERYQIVSVAETPSKSYSSSFGTVAKQSISGYITGGITGWLTTTTQPAAGLQHPAQLCQRPRPVLEVVQHEHSQCVVERLVVIRKRQRQVGHLQVDLVSEPLPCEPDHRRARIEPGHARAALLQVCDKRPGAAARVQDPPPGDVTEQIKHRRPGVPAGEQAVLVCPCVRLGEGVVVLRPLLGGPRLGGHAATVCQIGSLVEGRRNDVLRNAHMPSMICIVILVRLWSMRDCGCE